MAVTVALAGPEVAAGAAALLLIAELCVGRGLLPVRVLAVFGEGPRSCCCGGPPGCPAVASVLACRLAGPPTPKVRLESAALFWGGGQGAREGRVRRRLAGWRAGAREDAVKRAREESLGRRQTYYGAPTTERQDVRQCGVAGVAEVAGGSRGRPSRANASLEGMLDAEAATRCCCSGHS